MALYDIGYNYLFDKNGNAFIGRYNPNFPTSDVRGAHAVSANSKSIGVSFLGNADITGNVPQATLNLATNFLAWWYNLRGLNPTTSANIINQAGTITINLPRICGHKNLNPTAYTVNATTNAIGSFCHCPIQLTLPVVNYQGNTASFADNYNPADVTPSFTGLEANDSVFRFTITSRSVVTSTLGISGIWGSLLLTTNCPNSTAPTTYINSYQQWNGGTMTTTLNPGTYMLFVSSNSRWTASMPFTLNISTTPALRSDDNNSLELSNTALNLSIYPNPASDYININCNSVPQTARVINANGNLILEQQNITNSQFTLPVYQLQAGLYFIQAIDANGNSETVSFIINN